MFKRLPAIAWQKTAAVASVVAILAASPALAASDANKQNGAPQKDNSWIDITTWDYASVYRGWRASELLDEEVEGRSGDAIGEIEDLIIGNDGTIKAVVVEGGGFLDMGDTHARIPWDMVERNDEGIRIPFDEADFDDSTLIGIDDYTAREGNYRLRELLGDTVRDGTGAGYGYVRDVVFSQEGQVEAVIVDPDHTYGYAGAHPVPYSATTYQPYATDYWVPYMVEDLNDLEPYDSERAVN